MAELRAPEQNRLLGQLANMLRTTEGDIAAPEFLPPGLDVMGLVRQLMLPSAETVEKMSYGDPLFRMPTQSNIPITADREYLADVVGMIPFGAPAARPSARAMQDLVRQIQTEPPTGAMRMYHGTDKAFDEFAVQDRGLAYYVTPDPEQAGFYSGMRDGANIRPVEVDVKNTYRGGDVDKIMEVVKKEDDYYPYSLSKIKESLENQTPLAFHTPSVVKALKKLGYDSFAEYEGGIEQIGVFAAKDIKPSFGSGLLDEPAQSATANPLYQLTKEEFLGSPKIISPKSSADLKPRTLTTNVDAPKEPFLDGQYDIKMSEDGAAVLDGDKVIASYNFGKTLVVDPKYRKKGIAEELVYQWRSRYPNVAQADTRTKASQRVQEKVWERIQNEKFMAEGNL